MEKGSLNKEVTLDDLAKNTKLRDVLYLIGFGLIIVSIMLQNSMCLDIGGLVYVADISESVAYFLLGFKVLVFDRKNKFFWMLAMPLLLLVWIVRTQSPDTYLLRTAVCAVSAFGIRFEKIAKTYFYTALILLVLIVISSQVGLAEDLCYESVHPFWIFHVRHSFGIKYTTDFAAYVFFILVAYFAAFQKYDRFFYLRSLIPFVVAPVIYCLCITRLDCICILLLGIGMLFVGLLHRFENRKSGLAAGIRKAFVQLCIWSMPLLAGLMTLLTLAYKKDSPLLVKLDSILSSRLTLGRKGFDTIPLSLFGQTVTMHGAGGSVEHDYSLVPYFYLDSSYINCLLRFGVILTFVLIAVFVIIGLRNRNNHILLLCSALIALNCMIAHHLPDVSYDFMITAIFAEGGIALTQLFHRRSAESRAADGETPDSGASSDGKQPEAGEGA